MPLAIAPPGRLLRREDFTPERVRRIAEEIARNGGVPFMSEEARKASLNAVRAAVPQGEDVWVFGYGSLMWNPAIHVADSAKAHVRGYHRTFCLSVRMGRGSPQKPGLMLGMDRGGSCGGVVHRIESAKVESELTVLWYREMMSGAYEPRFVNAAIEGLGRTRALTFVVNRSHPRYEGTVPEEAAAQRIAVAEGSLGSNRDYLFRTDAFLVENGIVDAPIARLAARVRALSGETDITKGEPK